MTPLRSLISPLLLLMSLLVTSQTSLADPDQAPGRAEAGGQIHLAGTAFGTSYAIRFVPAPGSAGPPLLDEAVTALLDEIDQQMSLWRDDSELSRFNQKTSDDWFPVSVDTARVVAAAIEICRETDGAFDPTVAPLMQLWSFGPNQEPLKVPSEAEIFDVQGHVGIELLEVRLSPPAIRKLDPKVRLDLNAIAKGDAVDRVADLLAEHAPQGFMVEIGGEIRTSGTHADGSPWGIGIERPLVERRAVQAIVELTNASLATSGDYRNYVEANGTRYSHTIDPQTGRPIDHSLASVSVVADDCMTADAWATALMVLGPKDGQRIALANNLAAMFLIHEGDGFVVQQTPSFPSTKSPQSARPQAGALRTFLLAAGVFGVAITGMAIGVILSNRRLRGSCGGLDGLKDAQGNPLCEACTHPAAECEEFREQVVGSTSKPPE